MPPLAKSANKQRVPAIVNCESEPRLLLCRSAHRLQAIATAKLIKIPNRTCEETRKGGGEGHTYTKEGGKLSEIYSEFSTSHPGNLAHDEVTKQLCTIVDAELLQQGVRFAVSAEMTQTDPTTEPHQHPPVNIPEVFSRVESVLPHPQEIEFRTVVKDGATSSMCS